ncbi:MAG: transposase [Clostridia bacterium]|nr:transposase [Clostridia bacterium]MBQ6219646.1 transposase [Methanosphaera sp.]
MELSKNEQKKYEIIEKVVNNEITKNEAEKKLNLGRKQINRLIKVFTNEGKEGFVHKNRGKSNKNKKDLKLIKEIEELYLKEFYDYNFEAFYEEIEDTYDISYPVMCKAFLEDDIISPIAHKKTIKLYNEKMQNTIAQMNENLKSDDLIESKIELFKTRKIEQERAYIRRSCNLLAFGQEVQMDACFKIWFGNVASALHLAVDKATKKVLFGWFEYEEITRGYFIVLYHIIINYGIPYKIKTDNRSTFSTNRNSKKKLNTTQFEKICEQLDIILDTSSNAVSKANVERENKTFKNRLIAELRHENIIDIDSANKYLNEIFIPKMNKKFSYDINLDNSMMRKNDYSDEDLNLIISEKYTRIIDNASSISYKGKYYIPIDVETGEIVTYKHKTECLVIIAYDSTYWCKIENNYYRLHELIQRPKIIKTEETKNLEELPKSKYIPPENHPWRRDMKKFFNKK